MHTNFKRHKEDIERLIEYGSQLGRALQYRCDPDETYKCLKARYNDKTDEIIEKLPSFSNEYQTWYSETKALIRQLLPDRLDDLVRHYEKPKPRKEINFENYRIEDCLQNLVISSPLYDDGVKVDPSAAIPHFRQQHAILKSASTRLDSSLFDIKQLVQADLFDSELEAAQELLKKGHIRAAGAVAGVVLERHLKEVCSSHQIKSRRKNPSISDYNDLLKSKKIIPVPDWRRIQRMGDLRNMCSHSKDRAPTIDEIDELISGVGWATHTVF